MKKHWLSSRSLTLYQSRCVHVSSIPKVKKKCSEECIEIVIQYPFHTHGTVATIHGHKTTKHTLPIVYIDNIRCLKLYTNVRITNYCFILVCCNFFFIDDSLSIYTNSNYYLITIFIRKLVYYLFLFCDFQLDILLLCYIKLSFINVVRLILVWMRLFSIVV